jgi:hypothetical protein
LVFADDAGLPGVDRGLGPVGEVELAEDVGDVAHDSLFADDQGSGDFAVVAASGIL